MLCFLAFVYLPGTIYGAHVTNSLMKDLADWAYAPMGQPPVQVGAPNIR